jgi:hypothetical protein
MKENANLWLELSLIATAIFFHANVVVVVTAQGKRTLVGSSRQTTPLALESECHSPKVNECCLMLLPQAFTFGKRI